MQVGPQTSPFAARTMGAQSMGGTPPTAQTPTVQHISRGFGGTSVAVSPVQAATGESILMASMPYWGGKSDMALFRDLLQLTYWNPPVTTVSPVTGETTIITPATRGPTPLVDIKRLDILMEIIGMLVTARQAQAKLPPEEAGRNLLTEVYIFLADSNNTDPNYILWEQSAMDIGRDQVNRELAVQQTEMEGVKGIGKCRHCGSTEVIYRLKQTRSGDEGLTTFAQCVMCRKGWKE